MRSKLSKVKDKLPSDQNSNVVYRVPCSCGKFYIGGTVRMLETRLKEHKEACLQGEQEKSAVADHAWSSHHPILWISIGICMCVVKITSINICVHF